MIKKLIESAQSAIPIFQQTLTGSYGVNFLLETANNSTFTINNSTFSINNLISCINDSISSINNLIFSIVQFLVAITLLTFIFKLIIWMSREDEKIVVSPFDIHISEKRYNEKIISDSLILELRRIDQIHCNDYPNINPEKIILPKVTPNRECLEAKISSVGEFSIGGVNLPIGDLAVVLKQLWPLGGPGRRITGNLQECESGIRLTAQMEGNEVFYWDTSRENIQNGDGDQIISKIRELAFMIVYDISKEELQAKTWTGLKYYTEALEAYSRYTKNQQFEFLELSAKNCIGAKKAEPEYQLLYSLFYNLGIAYFNREKYECSRKMFEHSTDLNKNHEGSFIGLGASLSSLDKHEDALKAYDRALRINQENADAMINKGKSLFIIGRLEDALKVYNTVLETDPDDKDALYDRACIYCTNGKKKEALNDLKHAIKVYPEWKEYAKNDEDFKKLWSDELFKKLMNET